MIKEHLHLIEQKLKKITYFVDYSFRYRLDSDASTLAIWISANCMGGARLDAFEFLNFTDDPVLIDKYRYNFIVNNKIIRWDNIPHQPEIKSEPHHLHIDTEVMKHLFLI